MLQVVCLINHRCECGIMLLILRSIVRSFLSKQNQISKSFGKCVFFLVKKDHTKICHMEKVLNFILRRSKKWSKNKRRMAKTKVKDKVKDKDKVKAKKVMVQVLIHMKDGVQMEPTLFHKKFVNLPRNVCVKH